MRGIVLFAAGLFAGAVIQGLMAQKPGTGVEMMNHVGINVNNLDEAVTYYSQKMGFQEAFRALDNNGKPRLVYMQISKNTFLELQPATATAPAGFTHYGLVVENAAKSVDQFRQAGLKVSDAAVSSTKAVISNITDPYMGRIELVEITPESLHRKAIQSWK